MLENIRTFFKNPKGFFIVFLLLFVINSFWQTIGISQIVFLLISSFLLSIILTPSMVELSRVLGIVDKPDEHRKVHQSATALLGGVAVALSFAGAIILSKNSFPEKYKTLMIAGTLIALIGMLDDIFKVPAKIRLLFQFFLAMWVTSSGITLSLFPTKELWGQKLNEFLTIIWIIGFTNAYNFIDGLDGLAGGLGIIIVIFCSIISSMNGEPEVFIISMPLAGALLGFLVFNFKRAWIFLGDVGAQFCGFIISSISADTAWSQPGNFLKAITGPMLILWVLLFDMTQITILRIKYGFVKNITDWINFTGKDHIHHRLLFLSGSDVKAVIYLYIISTVLSSAFLFLGTIPLNFIEWLIVDILILLGSLGFMSFLDKKTSEKAFGIT